LGRLGIARCACALIGADEIAPVLRKRLKRERGERGFCPSNPRLSLQL